MEIIIISIAAGLIVVLYTLNVLVKRSHAKKTIDEAALKLQEAIRAYIDSLPILILKQPYEKEIEALRESWFESWKNPDKHWPIFNKIEKLVEKHKLESKLEAHKMAVDSAVHEYNTLAVENRSLHRNILEKSQ